MQKTLERSITTKFVPEFYNHSTKNDLNNQTFIPFIEKYNLAILTFKELAILAIF